MVAEVIPETGQVGRDDRQAEEHGLQDHRGHPLRERGEDIHVRRPVCGNEVAEPHLPGEPDILLDTVPAGELLRSFPVIPVADEEEDQVVPALLVHDLVDRPQEHVDALPRRYLPDKEHPLLPLEPVRLLKSGRILTDAGQEVLGADRVWYDGDPLPADTERRDVRRIRGREGDDPVHPVDKPVLDGPPVQRHEEVLEGMPEHMLPVVRQDRRHPELPPDDARAQRSATVGIMSVQDVDSGKALAGPEERGHKRVVEGAHQTGAAFDRHPVLGLERAAPRHVRRQDGDVMAPAGKRPAQVMDVALDAPGVRRVVGSNLDYLHRNAVMILIRKFFSPQPPSWPGLAISSFASTCRPRVSTPAPLAMTTGSL